MAAPGMGAGGEASAGMVRLALVLKLVVVPVGLAILAVQLMGDSRVTLAVGNAGLLVAALAVNQLALVLFASRMQLALRVFGIAIRLGQALRVHLQSVFYFFVLPMTVGQEMARFAKIRALAGPAAAGAPLAYALLADRLAGALAALLIAIAIFPFVPLDAVPRWDAVGAWLPWLVAGAAIAALLLAVKKVRMHARELAATARLGARGLAGCVVISLATHACFAAAVHLAARAVNIDIAFAQTLFAVSAGMLFVVIPVSFAGVSPVEAASLGVVVAMGLPVEQAATFAFIVYFAKLVAAFEGAAWEVAEGGGMLQRLLARRAVAQDPPDSP